MYEGAYATETALILTRDVTEHELAFFFFSARFFRATEVLYHQCGCINAVILKRYDAEFLVKMFGNRT